MTPANFLPFSYLSRQSLSVSPFRALITGFLHSGQVNGDHTQNLGVAPVGVVKPWCVDQGDCATIKLEGSGSLDNVRA
jgi:hypothetical protein